MPGWWNGRHEGLRSLCRKVCRFESCPGHHNDLGKLLQACVDRSYTAFLYRGMKIEATSVTNLVRSTDSGVYYVRAKIRGKLVWRSLDTATFSIAKLRLPDRLKSLREAAPVEVNLEAKTTFAEAVAIYKAQINGNARLKPAAKAFRLRSERTLRRTWPALFAMELRRITPEACKAWLARFENGGSTYVPPRAKTTRAGNSPTTVNALIAFLRHVFAIGVAGGISHRNAAAALQRKRPNRKLLRLPNKSQFAALVTMIRQIPGWGKRAGDLVEGLAFSGARIGELRLVTWGHVDLEKGTLTIPGEKTEAAPRVVPMTGKLTELLLKMKGDTSPAYAARVFVAKVAAGSLKGACKKLGIAHLTHHDLRHLFATTCIESGVDIPTVSRWLGHADGGALAMRTYGHLRPEHSSEAVKKVKFD
jgi:integrase